jgi:hypothetical protein
MPKFTKRFIESLMPNPNKNLKSLAKEKETFKKGTNHVPS